MIRLAPLEWQHWKVYRDWINDEEIALLVDRYLPASEFQHKEFYASLQRDRSKIFFSVLQTPGNKFVGVCALKNIDSKNRKAEFYICLNGPRGKGLGKETTQKCLDYAFDTLNLNRVYLYTPSYNKAALQCYKGVGFKEEGRGLEDIYSKGKYFDSVRMCYLKRFRPKSRKK
jgi:RimJ/RimL family protein N-acetyltransferase